MIAGLSPVDSQARPLTRWLLIQNPRHGEVPSEPQYVWVEEDKVPTNWKTLIRGTASIMAPPGTLADYWPPPGRVSPRQGVTVTEEIVSTPLGGQDMAIMKQDAKRCLADAGLKPIGRWLPDRMMVMDGTFVESLTDAKEQLGAYATCMRDSDYHVVVRSTG